MIAVTASESCEILPCDGPKSQVIRNAQHHDVLSSSLKP